MTSSGDRRGPLPQEAYDAADRARYGLRSADRLRVGYGYLRGARQRLGGLAHRLSDRIHLLAHALIGDDDWRARNG